MATHYCIFSAQIRPEIGEKLSIGLLLMAGERVYFKFSKNKLAGARGLLPDGTYRLLKNSLNQVEAAVRQLEEQHQTLPGSGFTDTPISVAYMQYLSRYNNNVLTVSAPKELNLPANDLLFDQLFLKFIDDTAMAATADREELLHSFKATHLETLQRHFNIDREFTCREIPGLIAPVRPDFAGINEVPVFAHAIDLSRTIYHIENDLAQLALLKLAHESNGRAAVSFVIAREPSKNQPRQHQVWQQLYEGSQFKYVDLQEPDKLLRYAEAHGVVPFILEETI